MKEFWKQAFQILLIALVVFLYMDGRQARSNGEYQAQVKELEGKLALTAKEREALAEQKETYQTQSADLKKEISGLKTEIKKQEERKNEILSGEDLLPIELAGWFEARHRPGTIFDGSMKFDFDVANHVRRDLLLWDRCEGELDLQRQLGGTLNTLNRATEGELATTDRMVETFIEDQATNSAISDAKDKRIKEILWEENKWKTISVGLLAFTAYSMAK